MWPYNFLEISFALFVYYFHNLIFTLFKVAFTPKVMQIQKEDLIARIFVRDRLLSISLLGKSFLTEQG